MICANCACLYVCVWCGAVQCVGVWVWGCVWIWVYVHLLPAQPLAHPYLSVLDILHGS